MVTWESLNRTYAYVRADKMRVDILSAENVDNVAERLRGQYRLIWLLGTSTGLRVSDILSLKAYQLAKTKAYIREKKTGKTRAIYIRKSIRAECAEYISKNNIPPYGKVFTVSRQAAWKAFKKAAGREGIRQNVGTHTMRKSYATQYIAKGYTIQDLKRRLNHSHINDTVGYLTTNEQMGLDEFGRKRKGRRKKKNGKYKNNDTQ